MSTREALAGLVTHRGARPQAVSFMEWVDGRSLASVSGEVREAVDSGQTHWDIAEVGVVCHEECAVAQLRAALQASPAIPREPT